jgi:cytochrome d ubiquinol oxidase subunit I
MTGVAAWYLLANREGDVARASLRLGTVAAFASTLLVFASGDRHARQVAHTQPAKFAAMEGLYSTTPGAPLVLFSLPPRQDGPHAGPELMVTNLTSFLAFGNFQAPVKGLNEFPRKDWPPVAATFLSFHHMVILGNLMAIETLIGLLLLWRGRLERTRWWLRLMVWSIPVPMAAIQLGWTTAEVGRQPWIVYGLMRTREAVSKVVTGPEVLFSIVLFTAIYLALGFLWLYQIRREVLHGPVQEPSRATPAVPVTGVPQEA